VGDPRPGFHRTGGTGKYLPMSSTPQFSLVLSGGGLKGLAHIGVLRGLEELGLEPSLVIGCSMGSLIAAAWATGMPVQEMEDRALAVQRKDVFRVAHVDMALKRMLAPAVYRKEPLDRLIDSLVGDRTFHDLPRRLVINTVDLNTGLQMPWGLPGLRDARVADAVFASCALPGIFPPRTIMGHACADGAMVENLPARLAASLNPGPVVAIDVGGAGAERFGVERRGFVATYARGLEIVMQTLVQESIRGWNTPPLVLVRPHVERISMFAFHRTPFLIAEGYRALLATIDVLPQGLPGLSPGIHPRGPVRIQVDRTRCTGCGLCVARWPTVFRMDDECRAVAESPVQTWSDLERATLRLCPTEALSWEGEERRGVERRGKREEE